MAQVSQIEINNQAFSTFRTTMNDSLSAINSMHSGTSRPASATTGTLWLDTTNAGSNSLTIKFFDGSDDITFATIDTSANTVNFIDSVVTGFDIVTDTTPQLGGDLASNGNDILFADNDKAKFGSGNDLEIFHDGSNSNISDVGTGQLVLRTDGAQVIINKGSSENMARFITDGAVELYHNNIKKFETTSSGIDVTGTAVTDGLTVENGTLRLSTSHLAFSGNVSTPNEGAAIFRPAADTIGFSINNSEKMRLTSTGLGIGSSAPSAGLEVSNSSGIKISRSGYSQYMQLYPANNNVPTILGLGGNGIHIGTTTSTGIHVDGSDNVLINTTSASGFDSAGLPLIVGSGSTHQGITIFSGTSHQGAIHFADGTGTSSYRGQLNYKHDADAMTFATSGSEKVRITSDGNFGISTTAPSRKLHIVSSDNQLARFESTDTYGGIELCDNTSGTAKPLISAVANDFVFYRGGSSHTVAFGATSVGFGVGTASPSRSLTVGGSSTPILALVETGTSGSSSVFFGDSSADNVGKIQYLHSSNDLAFTVNASERMRITSAGLVGIGTSSPTHNLTIDGGTSSNIALIKDATGSATVRYYDGGSQKAYIQLTSSEDMDFYVASGVEQVFYGNGAEVMRLSSGAVFNEGSGDRDFRVESNNNTHMLFVDGGQDRIGIGESAPLGKFHITSLGSGASVSDTDDLIIENGTSGAAGGISILSATNGYGNICFGDSGDNNIGVFQYDHNGNFMRFIVNASERARLDASGNFLVGKTSTTFATAGVNLQPNGRVDITRDGGQSGYFNRTNSDGAIVGFYKDGTAVGSIGSVSSVGIQIVSGSSLDLYSDNANGVRIDSSGRLRPINDNSNDLGNTNKRWNDIYATNGTIQTSDQNEKQSIQSLTIAEMNVAKKLSALIKTFKWNTAVEKKGDSARTHTGIIAQDIQQAFTDEELDASNYALFISSTWWEKEISVEATKENNAYTYIDTKEEATDGYTEKTRLGVRYPELLSFIQAYNDQRFTELEARITTLEANNP